MNSTINIILKKAKNITPDVLKERLAKYHSWFHYEEYDTSELWRRKASREGWQAIYWHNEYYNRLFDTEQKKYLIDFLKEHAIAFNDPILDVGCGIGRLSKFFSDVGYKDITGIDFPEMIARARSENSSDSIVYVASPIEDFLSERKFKLIISSGALSCIRKRGYFFRALDNCTRMQERGDHFLMIDPFHKTALLSNSRARITGSDVIKYMQQKGYDLEEKSGMLFLPVKLSVANKWDMGKASTRKMFYAGEKILALLSNYRWADYKILSFRKRC